MLRIDKVIVTLLERQLIVMEGIIFLRWVMDPASGFPIGLASPIVLNFLVVQYSDAF